MKKSSLLIFTIIAGFILLGGNKPIQDEPVTDGFYHKQARTVIDNKCYGCHSAEGKSQDAKDALMWDSLPGLNKIKIIATLDEIIEVLDENMMPPEEVVKKYPEMKLLEPERKTLMSWAESKADSLLN